MRGVSTINWGWFWIQLQGNCNSFSSLSWTLSEVHLNSIPWPVKATFGLSFAFPHCMCTHSTYITQNSIWQLTEDLHYVGFPCIRSFNLSNSTLSSLSDSDWVLESWSNLAEVTQLVGGRAGIKVTCLCHYILLNCPLVDVESGTPLVHDTFSSWVHLEPIF